MGLNSNAFLSPANDPMGSNGMHWRQLELSGNAKIGEFLKNGFRHFLWSGLFGGAILLGVSIYSQGWFKSQNYINMSINSFLYNNIK